MCVGGGEGARLKLNLNPKLGSWGVSRYRIVKHDNNGNASLSVQSDLCMLASRAQQIAPGPVIYHLPSLGMETRGSTGLS